MQQSEGEGPVVRGRLASCELAVKSRRRPCWGAGVSKVVWGGLNPTFLPTQALLEIMTPEYSREFPDEGVQPWLCANGRVPGARNITDEDMMARCEVLAQQNLKAPSTATFPGLTDGVGTPSIYGNCNIEWKS